MVYGGQSLLAAATALGTFARCILHAYQLPDPRDHSCAPPPLGITLYLASVKSPSGVAGEGCDSVSNNVRRISSWIHSSSSSSPSLVTPSLLSLMGLMAPLPSSSRAWLLCLMLHASALLELTARALPLLLRCIRHFLDFQLCHLLGARRSLRLRQL